MIRRYPSAIFYEGRIQDDASISTRTLSPLLESMSDVFQRMIFFDLTNSQESIEETSKTNREEALFTVNLIQHIFHHFAKGDTSLIKDRIGIITPYKAQVRLLKDMLGNWVRSSNNKSTLRVSDIEVNTVDAFQGREKDIILINCVRSNCSASLKGSLGFLVDERRMNVAITRAKHFLFIVGNSVTLSKNPTWGGLVKECSSNRGGLLKFTSHHSYSQAAL